MDIILLEVSHWHAPLYFEALEAEGAKVVAVSDRDPLTADTVAKRFGARAYRSWRELLGAEPSDFAVAFGQHWEMPAIADALIARGTPFLLEKPCGLTVDAVGRLRDAARARGIFVAVPLVQSCGPFRAALTRREASPCHAWFRFIAGPPGRYLNGGNAWMLEPQYAGGGCFMNLAGHFIELALRLLPRVTRVSARMSAAVYRAAVEDYALAVLESPDGGTVTVETGYLFPGGTDRAREVYYSLFDRSGGYVFSNDRAGHAEVGHPWREYPVSLDSDPLYATFVHATLAAFREGQPPPVGLAEMAAVMEVIEAAYGSASTGAPVGVNVPGIGGGDA